MSRQYVSELRAAAALQTRARILDAAQQELREVGYHAMTISGLARRAQVSPQTIYNALGSKAAVIKALYDVLLVGDDEPVPLSRTRGIHRADEPTGRALNGARLHRDGQASTAGSVNCWASCSPTAPAPTPS